MAVPGTCFLLLIFSLLFHAQNAAPTVSIRFHGPHIIEAGGITNIHVEYLRPVSGDIAIHHGTCDGEHVNYLVGRTTVGDHPLAKRHAGWEDNCPRRFVWIVPEGVRDGDCFQAYVGDQLVGVSATIAVKKRPARRGVPIASIADAEGPWFDGVAALKAKEPASSFVAQAKTKSVGILGGGISGLMTAVR